MGLTIISLPVMDGIATITDLYGHARDIKITKDNETFKVECLFHIYKIMSGEMKHVQTMLIVKEYSNDFLNHTWNDVYNLIKDYLDSIGIQYSDSI